MTHMHTLSGQQKADLNLTVFLSWIAGKTDADFRELVIRSQLSRQEIARECGFAKSVLLQNPRVKEALKTLEAQLRNRNLLPPLAEVSETVAAPQPATSPQATADKARLKRLEAENASLRAELTQLRTELARYRLLDDVLCHTGRLPR